MNGNQADNSAAHAGAAYVFVRSGGDLEPAGLPQGLQHRASSDEFGCSVAVSGDTVVVGASVEDSSATGVNGNQTDNSAAESGAAYVFVRSGDDLEPAGLPQGLQHRGGRRLRLVAWPCRATRWWSGRTGEDSNATGVNGNQSDNSAGDAGAAYVFVAQRHDLEPAGLPQGLQHRRGRLLRLCRWPSRATRWSSGRIGEDSNATA